MPALPPAILFTAFEPSGDELAAPVIAQLRQLEPEAPIFALGGPRMREAGAQLLEETTGDAAMLAGALGLIRTHRRRLDLIRKFLQDQPLAALVPVDSPAANWSICQLVSDTQKQARIIHLVCPQIWAWGAWRIGKLRRLTDHVLCLLPFEPTWLHRRGVRATFVGHPLFAPDRVLPTPPADLPTGGLKLALLPGSRRQEIVGNFPAMAKACAQLKARHPQLTIVVALRDDQASGHLEQAHPGAGAGGLPAGMTVRTGQTDAVLAWADLVLVVSGTATLQVARHRKPMVALYRAGFWSWNLIGRFLVRTRTFTLPNLISEDQGLGTIIPELIPHFGSPAPIVSALEKLISDPQARAAQQEQLGQLGQFFEAVDFAPAAATALLEVIRGER